MNKVTKNFVSFIAAFFILLVALSFLSDRTVKPEPVSFDKIVYLAKTGQITEVTIAGNEVKVVLKDNTVKTTKKDPSQSFSSALKDYGLTGEQIASIPVTIAEPSGFGVWLSTFWPIIGSLLLFVALLWFMIKQAQGANNRALAFGQSGAREVNPDKKKQVSFKDVAGNKEAKIELEEIVDFLMEPKKFRSLGARIPRGVLLVGPPGTGKTLLARAVAGEAGVPFFHISGSEFVEMFVGVGASRVRDLFKRAKKSAPAIIFIDEIDAVGRQRGSGLGGSHDEREQTLNQILVEMDGFDNDTSLIVMAATNRPDVLDPALLRPGRFDRQVALDLPDINDREAILNTHAKEKPLAVDVDLRKVAERTPGFSGADLANTINEAAILAARHNQKQITGQDIFESIEKVMLGPERKSHILSPEEKKITAYHEAGHALVAHILPGSDPVHKVSIISRGRAGGYTMKLPIEDKHLTKKSEFLAELAVAVAGYVVEKEMFGEVTTGPSSDLKHATKTARQVVMRYGMDDKLGIRTYGEPEELIFLGKEIHEKRDYSDETALLIDQRIKTLLDEAMKTAKEAVTEHKEALEKIAGELLEKETIEQVRFKEIMKECGL
ncbi:MAG: ATP-dependent zinc metalloprotease FtsH [bacterium]